MLNIVVLVSGSGTNLQAIIDRVNDGTVTDTQIKAVISNNPGAYALERARKHDIPHFCISPGSFETRAQFHRALLEKIRKCGADLIVLAGFMVVMPPEIIEAYRNRIINIHPSLIPAFCGKGYYGLRVHEAAIKKGVKVSGATVHFVDEGTDTGPIILQKAVPVYHGDTPEVLQRRIMEKAEWIILPAVIDAIAHHRVKMDGSTAWIEEE